MDLTIFSVATLTALAPATPPAPVSLLGPAPIHARRSAGGAVAAFTASVRIVASSARISAAAPPLPDMQPRPATVAAADGSRAPALIYDFE